MAKISKERQTTYYIGMGMIAVGFLMFISTFFAIAGMMNSNNPFAGNGPSFATPIVGFLLMVAGSFVMNIGAKGTAGSGLILDPDKARDDLKPFNEAKGGMISDIISNTDLAGNIASISGAKEVIKIKCRNCGSLNDEDAKFCKSCGQEL